MSQIQKKFLKPDSVDESKILLLNNGALRARNAADSADVSLMKLDGADKLQLLVLPQVSSDPVSGNDLVRKSHLDSELATAAGDVTALTGRVQAIEDDYGVAGGLATLDGAGLVPASQLPSYVDDVLEFANLAAFPATGETGKIYVAIDTSKCYRWSGSVYIQITSGAVDSVFGRTGIITAETNDYNTSQVPALGDNRYYTPTDQADIEGYADAAVAVETGRATAEEETLLKLDGSRAMTGDLHMDAYSIFTAANVVVGDTLGAYNEVGAGGMIVDDSTGNVGDYGSAGITYDNNAAISSDGGMLSLSGASGIWLNSEVQMSSNKIVGLGDAVDPTDAANLGQVDAAVLVEQTRAEAAELALSNRATALEAASLEFMAPELFVLTGTDISHGYIDLSSLAVQYSINAFVDRLAIHEGADYTVSVVGGKTRMTFIGSLVTPGQEKLTAGDEIRVKYAKRAI